MAESVAETEEKPVKKEKKVKDKVQVVEEVEDLATIRDKLDAVKQAIAKMEGPAAAETSEPEEAQPKSLTKNEKRKLAKQR